MSKELSGLKPIMRRRVLQTAIDVANHPKFKENKRTMDITDTDRTLAEQQDFYDRGLSQTLDSYHLLGLAVDMTVAKKFKGVPQWMDWSLSDYYRIYNDIAIDNGLRSLGKTHGYDYYHIEFPVIFQGTKPYCFAYVVINALQSMSKEWRTYSTSNCYIQATRIYNIMNERNMLRTTRSAIDVAIELGFVDSYETKKVREFGSDSQLKTWITKKLKNNEGICVSQVNKPVKGSTTSETNKIKYQMLKDGKGIYQHTACVSHWSEEGIHLINSHKNNPEYVISWEHWRDSINEFNTMKI